MSDKTDTYYLRRGDAPCPKPIDLAQVIQTNVAMVDRANALVQATAFHWFAMRFGNFS